MKYQLHMHSGAIHEFFADAVVIDESGDQLRFYDDGRLVAAVDSGTWKEIRTEHWSNEAQGETA